MWIEEFREAHGIERDEFARRVRVMGARKRPDAPIGCSEQLVYILERSREPRTSPGIANLIAEACGATPEQRDMIVAEKHRGKWKGDGVAKALLIRDWRQVLMGGKDPSTALRSAQDDREEALGADQEGREGYENPWRKYPAVRKLPGGKMVVKINEAGEVTGRYGSLTQAALENDRSVDYVERRVYKNIYREFTGGYSFRLASQWDRMGTAARKNDIEAVKRRGEEKGIRRIVEEGE